MMYKRSIDNLCAVISTPLARFATNGVVIKGEGYNKRSWRFSRWNLHFTLTLNWEELD